MWSCQTLWSALTCRIRFRGIGFDYFNIRVYTVYSTIVCRFSILYIYRSKQKQNSSAKQKRYVSVLTNSIVNKFYDKYRSLSLPRLVPPLHKQRCQVTSSFIKTFFIRTKAFSRFTSTRKRITSEHLIICTKAFINICNDYSLILFWVLMTSNARHSWVVKALKGINLSMSFIDTSILVLILFFEVSFFSFFVRYIDISILIDFLLSQCMSLSS